MDIFHLTIANHNIVYQWQFGEGKTPPPPGYTGYEFNKNNVEQTKNEAPSRHAQDIYASESFTATGADHPGLSSSNPDQNISGDDEKDARLVSVILLLLLYRL